MQLGTYIRSHCVTSIREPSILLASVLLWMVGAACKENSSAVSSDAKPITSRLGSGEDTLPDSAVAWPEDALTKVDGRVVWTSLDSAGGDGKLSQDGRPVVSMDSGEFVQDAGGKMDGRFDVATDTQGSTPAATVTWVMDNTITIGGAQVTALGSPKVTDTQVGKAVCFNGTTDGMTVAQNPLEGLARFTIEVLFQPNGNGPAEQRFVHVQADGDNTQRAMIETRTSGKTWYLDTFLKSGSNSQTLVDLAATHATDRWYWAALSYDGATMRAYVNGIPESAGPVLISPLGKGKTGLGMRLDVTYPFKGCIRELRFHHSAISAEQLQRTMP